MTIWLLSRSMVIGWTVSARGLRIIIPGMYNTQTIYILYFTVWRGQEGRGGGGGGAVISLLKALKNMSTYYVVDGLPSF